MPDLPHGLRWQDVPGHPPKRAAAILGVSISKTYGLVHEGKLKAVTLVGKTSITTPSIIALLRSAKPWVSNVSRTAKAVQGRNDVRARRRAEAERETAGRRRPASAARSAAKDLKERQVR